MDIKINSVASVTVANICQLVYRVSKRYFRSEASAASQQKKETLWHPGYNWCGPFIEINIGQICLN